MCVHAGPCICIPVVLSMSCPLTHLCWHAHLYSLMACVCVLRECALVQAVCVCVYGPIAAAAHHLWPSSPSGLLWLQTVPLGSQELGLCMSGTGRALPGWMDRSAVSVSYSVTFFL